MPYPDRRGSIACGQTRPAPPYLRKYQAALSEAGAWLSELAAGSGSARYAWRACCCGCANRARRTRCSRFGVEDLGAMLGITVETASRVLAALKREHVLGPMLRNQYQFSVDLALLEQIAHGDVPD